MAKKTRSYGYVRDLLDSRDVSFKSIRKNSVVIPDEINLWKEQSPVEDQGILGSCVAQALIGDLEFLLLRKAEETHTLRKAKGINYYDLSPLFTYYNARKRDGTVHMDAGTQIRSGIKSLATEGACREDMWPYLVHKFMDKPPKRAYDEAKAHKITSYYRINGREEMLECLAEGFPFVFGITVYQSFESGETSRTGLVSMPTSNEKMLGGHAMLCTGFSQTDKMFNFKNSWDGWGLNNKGYGKIPFQYMQDLSSDSWTVRV